MPRSTVIGFPPGSGGEVVLHAQSSSTLSAYQDQGGHIRSKRSSPPGAGRALPVRQQQLYQVPEGATDVVSEPGSIFRNGPAAIRGIEAYYGPDNVGPGLERERADVGHETRRRDLAEVDVPTKEAERRLAVSKAWDGAENMSSAYGDYLDDLDDGALAKLFVLEGDKETKFSGFYVVDRASPNATPR